jgi:hypothetical protein
LSFCSPNAVVYIDLAQGLGSDVWMFAFIHERWCHVKTAISMNGPEVSPTLVVSIDKRPLLGCIYMDRLPKKISRFNRDLRGFLSLRMPSGCRPFIRWDSSKSHLYFHDIRVQVSSDLKIGVKASPIFVVDRSLEDWSNLLGLCIMPEDRPVTHRFPLFSSGQSRLRWPSLS